MSETQGQTANVFGVFMQPLPRCQQCVAIRDGYRSDGRRMKPHYVHRQCRRLAALKSKNGFCQQHERCGWCSVEIAQAQTVEQAIYRLERIREEALVNTRHRHYAPGIVERFQLDADALQFIIRYARAALAAEAAPQEQHDHGAGLIGQTIPDVAETEPRPDRLRGSYNCPECGWTTPHREHAGDQIIRLSEENRTLYANAKQLALELSVVQAMAPLGPGKRQELASLVKPYGYTIE